MTDNNNTLYFIRNGSTILVAGLRWELTEGRRQSVAKRSARSRDADYFAMMSVGPSQLLVGAGNLAELAISPSEAKHSASLALSVLPLLGDQGWGIFKLDNGQYWFVAAQDGKLSVFTDVVGDQNTIRQALDTFLSFNATVPEERIIFCPAGFLPAVDGMDQTLDALLNKLVVPRFAKLHAVSNRQAVMFWAAMSVVMLGGYAGIQYYQSLQEAWRIADVKARLLAEKVQQRQVVQEPWKTQPSLSDFLAICHQQWKKIPFSIGGWQFTTADCTQQHIRLAWNKLGGGTIGDFSQRLAQWYPGIKPLFNIPGSADTGGISVPLQMPLPTAPESISSVETQTQRLINYAQKQGISLSLAESDSRKSTQPWRTFNFKFTTIMPPDRLFAASPIDDSGLRLTQITVSFINNAQLSYSLEGILYAQR